MNSHRDQLVAQAARYKLPSMFYSREQANADGLLSYGAGFTEAFTQAGGYAARILKGESNAVNYGSEMSLMVIRDWVEPGEGPAMSAMLRKRK